MNAMSSARHWVVAAAISASLLAIPGVAYADPLPAGCTQTEAAGPVTCAYTSGTNELLLPEGVTSVTVTAIGGRGGDAVDDNEIGPGGRGAQVTAVVAVPVETRTLYVVVGGNGASTRRGSDPTGGAGGTNGGGVGGTTDNGGNYFIPGAGGGGTSDVRTAPDDLRSRLTVAAGGGGLYGGGGGDAGMPGSSDGVDTSAQAGTPTGGGAGGISRAYGYWNGVNGALGVGGAGGPRQLVAPNLVTQGGGGGGGGLYGGGGGSAFVGSGAGGSSLIPSGGTVILSDAPPSVTITYQPPVTPPVCTGSACLPAGLFGSS